MSIRDAFEQRLASSEPIAEGESPSKTFTPIPAPQLKQFKKLLMALAKVPRGTKEYAQLNTQWMALQKEIGFDVSDNDVLRGGTEMVHANLSKDWPG